MEGQAHRAPDARRRPDLRGAPDGPDRSLARARRPRIRPLGHERLDTGGRGGEPAHEPRGARLGRPRRRALPPPFQPRDPTHDRFGSPPGRHAPGGGYRSRTRAATSLGCGLSGNRTHTSVLPKAPQDVLKKVLRRLRGLAGSRDLFEVRRYSGQMDIPKVVVVAVGRAERNGSCPPHYERMRACSRIAGLRVARHGGSSAEVLWVASTRTPEIFRVGLPSLRLPSKPAVRCVPAAIRRALRV